MEAASGRSVQPPPPAPKTFSTFTMQIIDLVERLSGYLAESEEQRVSNQTALTGATERLAQAETQIAGLRADNDSLGARLSRLEERMQKDGPTAPTLTQPQPPRPAAASTAASLPPPVAAPERWSPKHTDLRKRVDAADSALASLKLRSSTFSSRAPPTGGAPLLTAWESPLKAAVESAAATTGLSVEELLGTSTNDSGSNPFGSHQFGAPTAPPTSSTALPSYSPYQPPTAAHYRLAPRHGGQYASQSHAVGGGASLSGFSAQLLSNINSDSDPLVQAAEAAFQQRLM